MLFCFGIRFLSRRMSHSWTWFLANAIAKTVKKRRFWYIYHRKHCFLTHLSGRLHIRYPTEYFMWLIFNHPCIWSWPQFPYILRVVNVLFLCFYDHPLAIIETDFLETIKTSLESKLTLLGSGYCLSGAYSCQSVLFEKSGGVALDVSIH